MLQIHLPIAIPTATAQMKRMTVIAGRATFFKSAEAKRLEALLDKLLLPHYPAQPLDGPVTVAITIVWPYRKSERAAIVKAGGLVPHCSRPDLDNSSKMLLDALVSKTVTVNKVTKQRATIAKILQDDGQVAGLHLRKFWGPRDKVGVTYEIAPCPVPGPTLSAPRDPLGEYRWILYHDRWEVALHQDDRYWLPGLSVPLIPEAIEEIGPTLSR